MDRAFDLTREQHVLAIDAQRHDGYVCPCCCGRVHLRDGMSKIAHFAHKKDEGTPPLRGVPSRQQSIRART